MKHKIWLVRFSFETPQGNIKVEECYTDPIPENNILSWLESPTCGYNKVNIMDYSECFIY